nr:DUF1330 domain-containing protein [Mesorhizobium sp. M2D.F.Ca.ET.223.01.1.1]
MSASATAAEPNSSVIRRMPSFAKYGAKFIVRAGRYENPEAPTGNRHVVVEFDSYDTAVACYQSPEYQEASKYRLAASTGHFVIVEGA